MITTAQVATVVASIVATVPAHASIQTSVITGYVFKLLSDLDTEVVASATTANQIAEKNVVIQKSKQH